MEKYIYQASHSIPKPLCDDIIDLYESEDNRYIGTTVGGVNPTIKHTTDFIVPKSTKDTNDRWSNIEQFLYKELNKHLNKYLDIVNQSEQYLPEQNHNHNVYMLKGSPLEVNSFMIQKYEKGQGMYIYHNDYHVDYDTKRFRVITFLWYLNDVEEGGETEFWDTLKVQPEKGKLILFPFFWCFPHRGKMPISDNKYIITGWFYLK